MSSERMKAAVLRELNTLTIQEVPLPRVVPGSILVKVAACSVCGSDIRILRTGNKRVKFPAIMGHEVAGEIAAVGRGVEGFQVGEKLAVGADVPCGECPWCLSGQGNCCEDNYAIGYQFPGGFAEYCLLDPRVVKYGPVCKIPSGVTFEHAALAEPLACCLNGLERVFFAAGKSVLIIGAGPIGLLLLLTARFLGAGLILLADKDERRLNLARSFPADDFILTDNEGLEDRVMTITRGRGPDIIFTACAARPAQQQAIRLVAKHGFVNFFGGLPPGEEPIAVSSNDLHYREAYLTGSHGSTPRQHRSALDYIASGKIPVARLITHRFSLDEILKAFEIVETRQGLKVMVLP